MTTCRISDEHRPCRVLGLQPEPLSGRTRRAGRHGRRVEEVGVEPAVVQAAEVLGALVADPVTARLDGQFGALPLARDRRAGELVGGVRTSLGLSVILVAGCATGLELSVDLRGDLVPDVEVDEAVVRWERSGQDLGEESVPIATGDDLAEGVRLVDLANLAPGPYRVLVTLRLAGVDVADRSAELELDGDLAITIVVTRGCREDGCEPRVCATDADCTSSVSCVRPTCAGRVCLDILDGSLCPGRCDPIDGCVACDSGDAPRELGCERCGTQRQVCTAGAWVDDGACTLQGPCSPGDIEMGSACGMCGRQERLCQMDCTGGAFTCVGEGECMAGATDTGTRACTTGCGGNETRARSCGAACTWGAWSAWAGCPSCGPVCGDGTCDTGETCASCADCRNGHLGAGNNGDPCGGVPAETWRCVTRSDGARVSQVCRSGAWINFNLTPRDCNACVCGFSLACCQVGSPSGGC